MSLLALLIGTGITLALTPAARTPYPHLPFACIFSNAGVHGFSAHLGAVRVRGSALCQRLCDRVQHSAVDHGLRLCDGSSDPKEVLHSLLHTPVLYAMVIGLCIYLLQIPVPQLIAQPLELMANMTTPLSMVITGMLLAAGTWAASCAASRVEAGRRLRMLLIPAVCLAGVRAAGLPQHDRTGRSAAGVLSVGRHHLGVCGLQFGHDESFAAGSVVLTTLLSIVALPLCALVVTLL